MSKHHKKKKTGLPPESLVYTGSTVVEKALATVVCYDENHISEKNIHHNREPLDKTKIIWYDVRGLSDAKFVEEVGQKFNIHPLALEDVLNTQQRSKWEEYDNGIFVVTRAFRFDLEKEIFSTEQIAFWLCENTVVSFQENPDDSFISIRQRLENPIGKMRLRGADYLLYSLLDSIVDEYFLSLDKTEELIERLENQILANVTQIHKIKIYTLKRQLQEMRRIAMPLRETVGRFNRSETIWFEKSTQFFTRDLYDHVMQVVEHIESQKDMLTNLQDLWNAELSNRANHVMKTLTIVSAIFIPLTFIVGLYGMNFDNIPELHYPTGYFWVWAVMLIVVIGQLFYFKWKKWL